MLLSLALMLMAGFGLSTFFQRLGLPGLLGMMGAGLFLGPYLLDLIAPEILTISSDLRQMALIVILLRAGLSLELKDLEIIGRPALLMSFLPATLEMTGVLILAPLLFHFSFMQSALLGSVLAAVSPAVIVPKMLTLMEKGYGHEKKIPQLILAGASVDDIFVIVAFTSFLALNSNSAETSMGIFFLPLSLITGILGGILTASVYIALFRKIVFRDTIKVLLLLSGAFILVSIENHWKGTLPFSGLLATMVLGITLLRQWPFLAKRLLSKFGKIWVDAELMLFVLVGAAVNLSVLQSASLSALLLILLALPFRMAGVQLSLAHTPLDNKERLFCSLAYLPKATVQAAIGSIPLSMGIPGGEIILAVAVMSILITAPAGAWLIDRTYPYLLHKS